MADKDYTSLLGKSSAQAGRDSRCLLNKSKRKINKLEIFY